MNRLLEDVELSGVEIGTDRYMYSFGTRRFEKQCGCRCRLMADDYYSLYASRREMRQTIQKELTKWLLVLLKGMAELHNLRYALP